MRKSFLIGAIVLGFSLPSWAGTESHYFANAQTEKTPLDLFRADGSYVFESQLSQGRTDYGKQSAFELEAEYSHRFHIQGNWYFRAGVNYNRFDYSSTSIGTPDYLQSVGALLSIEYMVGADRGAFLEVRPGFYGQDNFGSESFDIPITLGRAWVLKPHKIFLFTGVNASFLRAEYPVLPVVGLVWHVDEHWLIYGVLPEPRIVYMPNKQLDLWLGGQLTGGAFRTAENNSVFPASLSHAVVDYSDYRAGAGLTWHISDTVDLLLGGGVSIQRRFNFERVEQDFKSDPAPYARLSLKAEF